MKRIKIALLASGAALLGLVAGSVPATSQEPPATTTIEVFEKEKWGKFIDAKPLNKQSPGDVFLFKSKLMNTETLERVGYMIGKVTMHKGPNRGGNFIGDATLVFPEGKLTVYGSGKFEEFEAGWTAPVTGGTGQYLGAGGSFTLQEVDVEGADTKFTIELRP